MATQEEKEPQKNEEVVVQVPIPDPTNPQPSGIVTTKRKKVIRGDNDRMTTDSNRFKET